MIVLVVVAMLMVLSPRADGHLVCRIGFFLVNRYLVAHADIGVREEEALCNCGDGKTETDAGDAGNVVADDNKYHGDRCSLLPSFAMLRLQRTILRHRGCLLRRVQKHTSL